MQEAEARVVRVSLQQVELCISPLGVCAGCTGLCATGLFSRFSSAGRRLWKLPMPEDVSLQAGDRVSLRYDASSIAQPLLVAAGLPMAGLLIGALAGFSLLPAQADLAGALGMTAGLLTGVLAARAVVRRSRFDSRVRIRLIDSA